MKKVLFILVLLNIIALNKVVIGQSYLENNSTGQKIYSTGFDAVNNNIRWEMQNTSGGVDTSGLVYDPSLWSSLDVMAVEQSDVGLTGRVILNNFGVGLIYSKNLLELDLQDWNYVK